MNKKQEARVLEIVKEYIDSQIKTGTGQALPVGYNPIEHIRGALFHWAAVPFNGRDIWCQLRCPNATQLEQCGDMSNIVLREDEKDGYSYEGLIRVRNCQEEICKLVFNIPSFDRIASLVSGDDFALSEKRAELESIKRLYEETKGGLPEAEKAGIDSQVKKIELQLGFILPDDTMAFICRWAMGNDVSDIKRLTRESLLKAASLAKAHGKAPSDYLSGVYTDFNKHEIDTHAFSVLDGHMKDRAAAGSGKRGRLLGGRGK